MEESYANIRELLGNFIDKKIIDITQQDDDEYLDHKQSFVTLMFDNGSTLKFIIGDDGFEFFDVEGKEE